MSNPKEHLHSVPSLETLEIQGEKSKDQMANPYAPLSRDELASLASLSLETLAYFSESRKLISDAFEQKMDLAA